VIRKSIWSLTADEMGTDLLEDQIKTMDESLKHPRELDSEDKTALPVLDLLSDDVDETETPAEKTMERLELGDSTREELDEYLNAELLSTQNGDSISAHVIERRRTDDGKTFGQRHKNPILASRDYEVEFQDGSLETFSTNTVVKHMYA
jgi:hypothetical protein